MSTPLALAAVGALAAASQLAKRGSRSKVSETDKAWIAELVRSGRVYEARKLSESFGHERLDLSGANLNRASLAGADLTDADLTGAILRRANLTGANLTGADLTGAYLGEVNLEGADLTGAILAKANLWRANLTGASLNQAVLSGADLLNVIGINLGPERVFKGTPDGYRIQRSRLSGRDYGLVRTI